MGHAVGTFRVYKNPFIRFLDYLGLVRAGGRAQIILWNGLKFWVRFGTSDLGVIDDVFNHRVYDRALNRLAAGNLVIDIGAHSGVFAVAAATIGAKVFCFEPLRENLETLEANAKLNGCEDRIIGNQLAVSAIRGSKKLFRVEGDTGGSTFFPAIHPEWNLNRKVVQTAVPCITLQEILDRYRIKVCNCLKMDCEGAEFEILGTAQSDDLRRVQTIILEYHPNGDVQQIRSRLERVGFVVDVSNYPCILYASSPYT